MGTHKNAIHLRWWIFAEVQFLLTCVLWLFECFVGKGVVQVVAGNEHTAVLCANGDIFTCGYNDSGQCGIGSTARVPQFQMVQFLCGKGVVRLFSGNGCEHFAALTEDGTIYTCGYNSRGQVLLCAVITLTSCKRPV